MPYIVTSAVDVTQNLDYELEGGDLKKTFPCLKVDDRLMSVDLVTCLMQSIVVPPELFSAVPQKIIIAPSNCGVVPDFAYSAALGGIFIVSDKFVSLMSGIEPASQQFLAIAEAVTNRGEKLDRAFFLMNVLLRLDAVDIEHSTVQWKNTPHGTRLLMFKPGPPKKKQLVLLNKVTDGHHIWRGGRQQFGQAYFCSDFLKNAIVREQLVGLSFERVLER